jgi:hypothetical protein
MHDPKRGAKLESSKESHERGGYEDDNDHVRARSRIRH